MSATNFVKTKNPLHDRSKAANTTARCNSIVKYAHTSRGLLRKERTYIQAVDLHDGGWILARSQIVGVYNSIADSLKQAEKRWKAYLWFEHVPRYESDTAALVGPCLQRIHACLAHIAVGLASLAAFEARGAVPERWTEGSPGADEIWIAPFQRIRREIEEQTCTKALDDLMVNIVQFEMGDPPLWTPDKPLFPDVALPDVTYESIPPPLPPKDDSYFPDLPSSDSARYVTSPPPYVATWAWVPPTPFSYVCPDTGELVHVMGNTPYS